MKFDLTKNIQLDPLWRQRYRITRWLLGLAFLAGLIYLGLMIFFPSQAFSLNKNNRNITGNTTLYDGGNDDQGHKLLSAYSDENFSTATLEIIENKNSPSLSGQKIAVRKTYQAFAYSLAAQPVNFAAASPQNGTFTNGTLLSFNNSVFIAASGKVMPFDNPITFTSMGYNWNDVMPATESEIGLYQRDKLFTIDQPHPAGTVFFTRDSKKYFLIQDKQRKAIVDPEILKTYLQRSPILIDEKSLDFSLNCVLKKNLWPLNSYSCTIAIDKLSQFLGNDYQFAITGADAENAQQINLTLSRSINWNNMRNVLSDIKHKFLMNYGYEAPK